MHPETAVALNQLADLVKVCVGLSALNALCLLFLVLVGGRRFHRALERLAVASEATSLTVGKVQDRLVETEAVGPYLLIVDDEPSILNMVADMVRREGLTPLRADTLTAALTYLYRRRLAGAVLDWTLPNGSAGTIYGQLREANVPTVVYTGHDSASVGVPEGATTIQKPGIPEIRAWIRRVATTRYEADAG